MIHPQHKLYTITISPAAGLPFSRTLSARLPQAVQWARAIASTSPLPATITITTGSSRQSANGAAADNICWSETVSATPQP